MDKKSFDGKKAIDDESLLRTPNVPESKLPSSSSPPKRPRRSSQSTGVLQRIRRNTTSEMPSCAIFSTVSLFVTHFSRKFFCVLPQTPDKT